jgi:ribonucleoside-diphosphate reductase alpha chain
MISAVFRRGGDTSFVAEELKAVFDPRGGAWMGGRYVPSLLAAIGDVIEQHLDSDAIKPAADGAADRAVKPRGCPKCGAAALVRAEGCDRCLECGYSKCS